MCLAIPSKVISLDGETAVVDVGGARRVTNLMLMPEPAAIGDYLLIHAGFAIQKIGETEGLETLALLEEVMNHQS